MNRVVKILMERDGITKSEAMEEVKYAKQAMQECGYDYSECEDIMLYDLGLEMDYIMDVIG